jgi:hypothetical protein
MNLIEQTLEAKLSERSTADMLKKRYDEKDWNGLLEAALLLNTLHHMERAKTAWAIREAASNQTANNGMDRDSA